MSNEISIIITLSVIIFISPYLAKIFKIPTTPIEIVLGSLAGYFGFILDNGLFHLIAEIGFFYLMFLAGTEVNLKVLLNMQKDTLKKSIIYISMLYVLAFIFSRFFHFGDIFIVIMPLISVGLILTLFKEYGKDNLWLNLSMSVGTLGEVVSIMALTLVGAMLEHGIGVELYKALGYLALFLIAMGFLFKFLRVIFWWYPELKTLLVPINYDKDEKDIRLSMALFFLMIAVMLLLNLEIAFGAFIAGMFIATFFEYKEELPHKLSSFGFGFLVPIFFVYIGSTFKLESLLISGLIETALIITFSMIGIRIFASLIFYRYLGLKQMLLFALSHSMPLTLLIAIATLAYQNNNIDQFHYYGFILASLFQVIITMICIKFINRIKSTQNAT